MRKEFYWKIVLILVVVVVSVWFAHPIKEKINLGLDLQGGMHLVLDVEAEKAVESTLDRYVMNLRDSFKKDKIESASVERDKDNILINLSDTSKEKDVEKAVSEITDMEKISSSSDSNRMVYQINGKMRKNIDQFGVAEPSSQRQGDRRIIIQLPGIKDTDRAIQLIGKTAQLEFKLVDDDRSLEDALKGNIADGDEMLYQRITNPDSGEASKKPFLIKKEGMMTGESIVNAEVRIDS